jgi:hypothetical protein
MVPWLEPEVIRDSVLSTQLIESWRTHGFALVTGLLPADLIGAAQADALTHYPAGAAEATDFGSGGQFVFPAASAAVNAITLHPNVLGAVAQLLSVAIRDIRLTQSDLWAKYGRAAPSGDPLDNDDQRMHVDYPNHTLTHPPPWDAPEAVEMIIYLSDVDECGGATHVVARHGDRDPAYPWPIVGTPGVAGLEWVNDRRSAETYLTAAAPDVAEFRAEHLYAREAAVRYQPGSVLLYRHDTWHRGTPITPGALRIVINLTFRLAASEWISTLHEGWSWAMYRREQTMERLITEASVDQRCVLGFPAPGSAYWTHATLAAVEARYPGIDLDPYR